MVIQKLRKELIATEGSLKENRKDNGVKVQKHSSVKDMTAVEKPLEEVVNDTIKNSNILYNQDAGTALK